MLRWLIAFSLLSLLATPIAQAADTPKASADASADPLPDGALFRIGTARLRHAGSAIIVAWAPDGKTLASGGNDHVARLWDAATGKEIRHFTGTKGTVDTLCFSTDGKTLVTSGTDRIIRLWDVGTGKELSQLTGHTANVLCVCLAPDGKTLASKGRDGTMRLWDVSARKEVRQFRTAPDTGTSNIVFTPAGKGVISVAPDSAVTHWDTTTGEEVRRLVGHKGEVPSLDLAQDGKRLVSAGADGTVRVWDLSTGKELVQTPAHAAMISTVRISPNGKLLATGSADRELKLWDAATGKALHDLPGHFDTVSEVAFSPDGKTLASASWDWSVRLWDVATGKELAHSANPPGLTCAGISVDGKRLATGHADGLIRQWDAETGKMLPKTIDSKHPLTALAVAPDGKSLAVGSKLGGVSVFDAVTGARRFAIDSEEDTSRPVRGFVGLVRFAPDNSKLLAAHVSAGNTINLYDATNGKPLALALPGEPTPGPRGNVLLPAGDAAVSLDGHTLAVIGFEQTLTLYDIGRGKEARRRHATLQEERLTRVAFAPNERWLATSGAGGTVYVWETASGSERRRLEGDKIPLTAVAVSPDGRLVAAGLDSGIVRVWHLATGEKLRDFTGHDGIVKALAFTPNGRLFSACLDGTGFLWDVSRLKPKDTPAKLSKDALDTAWANLLSDDAKKAFETVTRLTATPDLAVELFRTRLTTSGVADAKVIDKLIAQLDDEDFEVREKATKELAALGGQAEGALRRALKATPSAEVTRRIEELLKKQDGGNVVSGERLRQERALEVLEDLGTPETKKLLEALTKGPADAWLTTEAQTVLKRMIKTGESP
jgi:WD40 repeat protein